MKTYALIGLSFDGDYVIEHNGFKTIESAWERAEGMGSRWYFYPFWFVFYEHSLRVADTPEGLERFKGKSLPTVRREFERFSKMPELQNADAELFSLCLQHNALPTD